MKSSIAFLLATVVLAVSGSTVVPREPRRGGNGNHNNGGNTGGNNNSGAAASASATTTASSAGASVAANNGNNNNNNNGGGNNNNNNNGGNNGGNNPQTSLTLDPSVICTACTDDGQNPPVNQQSPSLTSSNNFINFCQGKTLTNGQQIVTGSCNGVVYGDIIPSANMPASKIVFPPNGGTFPANQDFTFKMNIKNMVTGNFVNANTNYYGAPQQLQNGVVVGHTHVTVQLLDSISTTQPADPTVFAFFKGINQQDTNGVLTVDVAAGLPAGAYRFCTMNTDANHTPVMVAIAQHGSLDDCIYATAVDNGNGGNNSTSTNTNAGGAAASATSAAVADVSTTAAAGASTTAAAAATSSAAAGGNKNGGSGRNRGGQGRGGRGRGGRGRRPHHQ